MSLMLLLWSGFLPPLAVTQMFVEVEKFGIPLAYVLVGTGAL
jgi:hypothetical protein